MHGTRKIGTSFRELTLYSQLSDYDWLLALAKSSSNFILGEKQSPVIHTIHKLANSSVLCIAKESTLVLEWNSGRYFYAFHCWFENAVQNTGLGRIIWYPLWILLQEFYVWLDHDGDLFTSDKLMF